MKHLATGLFVSLICRFDLLDFVSQLDSLPVDVPCGRALRDHSINKEHNEEPQESMKRIKVKDETIIQCIHNVCLFFCLVNIMLCESLSLVCEWGQHVGHRFSQYAKRAAWKCVYEGCMRTMDL